MTHKQEISLPVCPKISPVINLPNLSVFHINDTASAKRSPNHVDVVTSILGPRYAVLSHLLLEDLGFDAAGLISLIVALLTFGTAMKYFFARMNQLWNFYLSASMTIDEGDELFQMVLDWVSTEKF